MKKAYKKMFNFLKREKLPGEELERVRIDLISFMQGHPLKKETASIFSFNDFFIFRRSPAFAAISIFAFLIVIGGGISYAAGFALPGDLLYPVKISVNEKAQAVLKFSPQSKAEWRVQLVSRRLAEAEKLSLTGQFNLKAAKDLSAEFTKQIDLSQSLINDLKIKDQEMAASISSSLEASLKAHADILVSLAEKNTEDSNDVKILENEPNKNKEKEIDFLKDVAEKTKRAVEIRTELEKEAVEKTTTKIKEAAENKLSNVKNKIAETQKIHDADKNTGAAVHQGAQTKLEGALGVMIEGEHELDQGNYEQAYIKFQESIRSAQEAKILFYSPQPDAPSSGSGNLNQNINSPAAEDLKAENGQKENQEIEKDQAKQIEEKQNRDDDFKKYEESINEVKKILNEARQINTILEDQSERQDEEKSEDEKNQDNKIEEDENDRNETNININKSESED